MNAFGDATMALALFMLVQKTGSLDYRGRRRALALARRLGDQLDRARPARRRGRQVGPDPAADVASGRHGGPDPGQRADPRGDHGDRRRLPDRPHAPDLRAGAQDRGPRRRARHAHPLDGRADRARADGHQAGRGVLDDVADRLHVPRRRPRRLRERDVPPDDARLLQGAALPRGRPRDPRAHGRAGHPPHAGARLADADDEVGLPDRLARPRRRAAVRRLLLQGRRSSPPRPSAAPTAGCSWPVRSSAPS